MHKEEEGTGVGEELKGEALWTVTITWHGISTRVSQVVAVRGILVDTRFEMGFVRRRRR